MCWPSTHGRRVWLRSLTVFEARGSLVPASWVEGLACQINNWTATRHFNCYATKLVCMLVWNALFLGTLVNTDWTGDKPHLSFLYPIHQFGVKTSVCRCEFERVDKCESEWNKVMYVYGMYGEQIVRTGTLAYGTEWCQLPVHTCIHTL